jgi:hypothetical protein
MIGLVGDIHGVFRVLPKLLESFPPGVPVIQVGDFGYWPDLAAHYRHHMAGTDRVIETIDGNHDHVVNMADSPWPNSEWPNMRYHRRGTGMVMNDVRVLFFGGAMSVDRAWRPKYVGDHAWFPEEVPTPVDVARALHSVEIMGGVDLLVTHSPPDWMIRKHFSEEGLRYFNHDPKTWRDEAALRVEQLWRAVGEPDLVCGHMHRPVEDGKCRILDINETMLWMPAGVSA